MRYIDLTEGPNDPHIFKAILLAGGPGAGKSTVSDRLGLQRKGLRVINSDDALEHLMRKGNLDFSMPDEEEPQRNIARDRAKQVAKTKERLALDGRLGLLIDGTAKDVEKTASVKKRLESYGYQVMMLFVDTSLRTALERNNMRPRRVPVNVVTKSHAEVQKNKEMLRNLFGTDFVEVNNEGTPDLSAVERKINSFLNAPISSVAKDWVSKQRVVQEDTLTESRPVGQYVYHATTRGSRPEQLIKSLISYGLRPSKQGYAGPGTYFAYEPDEGFYHLTPDEAVILRVKWDKLVKLYGVYPSNPDGIERDDEEIVVPGPVPSQIIEIELDPDHWVSLPVALRAVQARDADALMRESTPVDETLKKIKDRWALVSKHNPKKVLQYYKGSGHPSKEWVNKVERRVHAFEDVTPDQLKKVEDYADVLFNKVGIDVEFTRHFIDRVNDARNRKPITAAELVRLFREEYLKWGKPIARLGPDAEAVMRDMQTDVNMPFVLNWNRSTQQLELKAKTVMRKPNFKTPDPVFAVEAESAVDEALSFPIPRNQMPQIDLEHVKHDFKTRRGTVSFSKLIPVQTERVPGLVDKSIDMILADKIDKPILVDQQGHIVNGHHRYDAYKKLGAKPDFPVPVIMIFATLEEIIDKYKHTASDDHVITPVTETTAGSIATVAVPLGGLQRRPNPSIYNHVAGAVRPRKKKK